MADYQMFKTTLMKGFDKDEVIAYIQKMEGDTYAMESEYKQELKLRDAKIEELKKRIALKDEQKDRLEMEIEQKYKKYIDNYDRIGGLVYEAQIRADELDAEAQAKAEKLVAEAQERADQILAEAERVAAERGEEVQREVNEKLAEGKKKYIAVQEELNEIVELINQAQRRFMTSYKEVHNIIKTMPISLS